MNVFILFQSSNEIFSGQNQQTTVKFHGVVSFSSFISIFGLVDLNIEFTDRHTKAGLEYVCNTKQIRQCEYVTTNVDVTASFNPRMWLKEYYRTDGINTSLPARRSCRIRCGCQDALCIPPGCAAPLWCFLWPPPPSELCRRPSDKGPF